MGGRSWLAVFAAIALAGCSANGVEEARDKAATAATRRDVAVEVAPAQARDIEQAIDVVGTLEPKFEAAVKAELPGLVTDVYVTQWVRVRRGQPLARIDARELQASLERARAAVQAARASEDATRAGLLEARVAADRAERELARLTGLKASGLATQQSLDDGVTARDAAQARIAAVQSQIGVAAAQVTAALEEVRQIETRLTKAVIYSPLDGVVAERLVNVGDLPGDKPIFRVVDNAVLNLTVSVPSRYMERLKLGQPLRFTTDAFPGEAFAGRVMFVNPSVDAADRSVKVVAEVRNVPERLKGGLFVKGRIVTGDRRSVLQVPRQALLTWDVASARGDLFVVDGATARRKVVQTGVVEGDSVEVASGLAAGERVVVRGAFNLKDGDPVRIESPSVLPPSGGK